MLRNYIIFAALLVKASFSKIEGKWFPYDFFKFSDKKIIFPEYAESLTFYIAFLALAWDYYLQELKYKGNNKLEMFIFAWLMTGELADYILRFSETWFQFNILTYNYSFSYDSFIFIIFTIVIIRKMWIQTQLTQKS